MTEPNQRPTRPAEPSDLRIRRTFQALVASFLALVIVVVARLVLAGGTALDWLTLGLVLAATVAAVTYARAVTRLDERRAAETASFTRILRGLSRSVSADAILDAIVEEVGQATGADHVAVVRRRPDARVLEARLVSTRAGVPETATQLPIADLEEAGPDGARLGPGAVADRLARRVRMIYGLAEPIAVPLRVEQGVIGAIVLSRRVGAWPPATHRLLADAATEASAALDRAYTHRTAERNAATDALTGLPNRR